MVEINVHWIMIWTIGAGAELASKCILLPGTLQAASASVGDDYFFVPVVGSANEEVGERLSVCRSFIRMARSMRTRWNVLTKAATQVVAI